MLAVERKQTILDTLGKHTYCTIAQLSDLLQVSEMTIRRDLKALEEEGCVIRTHGGASRARGVGNELRYEEKKQRHFGVKNAIARYAAENVVQDNGVIILEGGTTVGFMADFLQEHRNLTIITNGLDTLAALKASVPKHTVLSCGGMLRDTSHTFVGPIAEQFFAPIHADYLFVSASGVTAEQGFTDPNMLEAQIKLAMAKSAKKKVMLLNSEKFGQIAMLRTFGLQDIDVLITDDRAPEELLELIRSSGADVHVVSAEAEFPT